MFVTEDSLCSVSRKIETKRFEIDKPSITLSDQNIHSTNSHKLGVSPYDFLLKKKSLQILLMHNNTTFSI